MKTKTKKKTKQNLPLLVVIIMAVALALIISQRRSSDIQEETVDPHEGQIKVFNGSEYTWIYPAAGMPVNTLSPEDFTLDENGLPIYTGNDCAVFCGIDVSQYQGDIDWAAVKESGIDFAILRIGGRGYGEAGNLVTDEKFATNIEGAKAAGIKVGAYFFSQAISTDEAVEEAKFALQLLDGASLDLPLYYDWEYVTGCNARTDNMSGEAITECALSFCQTVENAGYEPGIYTNVSLSYYSLDLSQLTEYDFWCAAPGNYPYYYYDAGIWQYSFTGSVAGIGTVCDMNYMFVKYQ